MKGESPWAGSSEPEHITRIRVLFASYLPERVRIIAEGFEALASGEDAVSRKAVKSIMLQAHRLAGTAQTFGGIRIGEIAAQIDQILRRVQDDGGLPSREVTQSLHPLIEGLRIAEREFLQWMEGEDRSSDWGDDETEGRPSRTEEGK